MSQTQGLKFVLPLGIEDDSRYLKLKEQMGFEGEGVFWAAYRTIRRNGGLYPYQLLVDLLKCHRTPGKRVRRVLEEYGLFEVNSGGGISIARLNVKGGGDAEDPRQTRINFEE